ncbi:hypothetical protein PACTADRAFT_48091 [Pachysolen tannophilus NRRL Y-2460]|uniref:Uncharacterized protein n=1 Tax=Pachysolen tannophilus NRRL Y-2460 TaxID=669874 RepID=A0A1E4U2T8_PACTA|nr:hypothetical protein PACTADRAFT_48091 [Pachysolen tannophilus NRRL Y-2460]
MFLRSSLRALGKRVTLGSSFKVTTRTNPTGSCFNFVEGKRFNSELSDSQKRVVKLVNKLNEHENVKLALEKTSILLREKGFDKTKLTMMQQVKLLLDKDVKASLVNFKNELDKAGIELKEDDVKDFMSLFQNPNAIKK